MAPNYFVHESSYVDEPCQIGEGTKIWHFSHVMKDSVIGPGGNIGQNVVVSAGVRMGRGCKIQNNVSLYTGVILEDYVFCGPSMVFTNVVNPRSEVVRKDEYKTTLVRRGASTGGNPTVVCGAPVGQHAFVEAGRRRVDRRRGWMCRCGIKLRVESASAQCAVCGTRYHFHNDVLAPA